MLKARMDKKGTRMRYQPTNRVRTKSRSFEAGRSSKKFSVACLWVIVSVAGRSGGGEVFLATGRLNSNRDLLWTGSFGFLGDITSVGDDRNNGSGFWRDLDVWMRTSSDRDIGSHNCGVGDGLEAALHGPRRAASHIHSFVGAWHLTRRTTIRIQKSRTNQRGFNLRRRD